MAKPKSVNTALKKKKKDLHEVSVKKKKKKEEEEEEEEVIQTRFFGPVDNFTPFSFINHPVSAAVCLCPFRIFTLQVLNALTNTDHSKDVKLLTIA